MPCLFLTNVQPHGMLFDEEVGVRFLQKLANAIGGKVDDFEVHFSNTTYMVLNSQGRLEPAPNVHVFVIGFARPIEQKRAIAEAIHAFLSELKLGQDSDITFIDCFYGDFFLNGEIVPVPSGPLRP